MEALLLNWLRIRTSLFVSKDTFQKTNISVNINIFFTLNSIFILLKLNLT